MNEEEFDDYLLRGFGGCRSRDVAEQRRRERIIDPALLTPSRLQ